MPKSTYLANKVLDHVLGGTVFTPPASLYYGLFTAAPSAGGGGTEVSGGSYARKQITNNTTNNPNASGGSKANGSSIDFPFATAGWGTLTHVAIFDAPTGGNMLYYAALTTPRTVNADDAFTFQAGQLTWTET